MNPQEILNKFKSHKLNIINEANLIEYIEFCIKYNQSKKIKFETSHHHILPQAKTLPFEEYSNLNENDWNGVHLLHKDHYKAHWLLTQSINQISILVSFGAMHNMDIRNNRIDENDLIEPKESQEIMERRSKEQSKRHTEWNKVYGKENIKKMNDSLDTEIIIDGKSTTMRNETNKKATETRNKLFMLDGVETSIAKEIHKKAPQTVRDKGLHYDILHINGGIIHKRMAKADVRKISSSLLLCDKSKYLGYSNRSLSVMNQHSKLHLRGMYAVLVD